MRDISPLAGRDATAESAEALAHRPVVVIPAYNPGNALPELVRQLAAAAAVQAVIVVNDGSGTEYAGVFEPLAAIDRVHVLNHFVNLGKGAALKTGFNYAGCTFRAAIGIVTADADGQHAAEDVVRVAEMLGDRPQDLVLGARRFEGEVPFRSRAGNRITRYVMRVVAGQKISDTQTGLRGVPMGFVPMLLKLRPNGYDFELDMLLAARRAARRITEVGIQTIYVDDNRSSHFDPLLDSMRIYFLLVRFAAVSLTTVLIDNLVFLAAFQSWPYILGCQALSRSVAGIYQYYMNKSGVFHSKVQDKLALPKFVFSVVLLGIVSYLLINVLTLLGRLPVVWAKLTAETILFFFSFIVQRDFVFAAKPDQNGEGRKAA